MIWRRVGTGLGCIILLIVGAALVGLAVLALTTNAFNS